MNAFFIASPTAWSLVDIAECLESGGLTFETASDERLVAMFSDSRVWIAIESDHRELPSSMRDAAKGHVLALEYSSIQRLLQTLDVLTISDDSVVDNDHGTTVSFADFMRMMDLDPEWDWRLR